MIETRWYLTRTKAAVALVVEETAEPNRGYMATVSDRQHARAILQTLRTMVEHIDDPARPLRTYDPTEWLENDLGLSSADANEVRAEAARRVARGEYPDVRPVSEDGDRDVDIAASRRRDHEQPRG